METNFVATEHDFAVTENFFALTENRFVFNCFEEIPVGLGKKI
jgi:carotenoid cleavage dioxygenase-like enzyme